MHFKVEFRFDFSGGRDDKSSVLVEVDDGMEIGSKWVLSLGCPGDSSSSVISNININVHEKVDSSLKCATKIFVDDHIVLETEHNDVFGRRKRYSSPIGFGQHSIRRESTCFCGFSVIDCEKNIFSSFEVDGKVKPPLPNFETVYFTIAPPGGQQTLKEVDLDNLSEYNKPDTYPESLVIKSKNIQSTNHCSWNNIGAAYGYASFELICDNNVVAYKDNYRGQCEGVYSATGYKLIGGCSGFEVHRD